MKPLNHFSWVVTNRGKLLHCVPDVVAADGRWHDSFLDDPGMEATGLCGRRAKYYAPGIFTRMEADRCPACCESLSIPSGRGTPLNEGISVELK